MQCQVYNFKGQAPFEFYMSGTSSSKQDNVSIGCTWVRFWVGVLGLGGGDIH